MVFLALLLLSGLVFSATTKQIFKNANGVAFPAGVTVMASVEGHLKSGGGTCTMDFYGTNDSMCSNDTSNGFRGYDAGKGSYIDYVVTITNVSNSSPILVGTPFHGLARYNITAVPGSDDGPYQFLFGSVVIADNGATMGDCTLEIYSSSGTLISYNKPLEIGEYAIGKCRTIIHDSIPPSSTQFLFGDAVILSPTLGSIRFSTQGFFDYDNKRLIQPTTSGVNSSGLAFPNITSINTLDYSNSFSSNNMPTKFTFSTSNDLSESEMNNIFTNKQGLSSPQAQGGGLPVPQNRCSITRSSSRNYVFQCNMPNDIFSAWDSPQTILPAPWDYTQYLLTRDEPNGSNAYEGASSLTGRNLVFQIGYYGQSRRWHPSPYVNNNLKDKSVQLSYIRPNQSGSIYINRTDPLPITVGFLSYRRNNGADGGQTGPFVDPRTDPAYDGSSFFIDVYNVPSSQGIVNYLSTNPTPLFEETFTRSKVDTPSLNSGTKSFDYKFDIPSTTINTVAPGSYQLVAVLRDAANTNIRYSLISHTYNATSFVRFMQPPGEPTWSDTSIYDRIVDGVAHPLAIRNLYTSNSTLTMTSNNPSQVKIYESSSGYCTLDYPTPLTGTPGAVVIPPRIDVPGEPPAINKVMCIIALTPGNYTINAQLTSSGGRVTTESLNLSVNTKGSLLAYDSSVGTTEPTATLNEAVPLILKNWFATVNGGVYPIEVQPPFNHLGELEGGVDQQRVQRMKISTYSCSDPTDDATCTTVAQYSELCFTYMDTTTLNCLTNDTTPAFSVTAIPFLKMATRSDPSTNQILGSISFNQAGRYKITSQICDYIVETSGAEHCLDGSSLFINVTSPTGGTCIGSVANAIPCAGTNPSSGTITNQLVQNCSDTTIPFCRVECATGYEYHPADISNPAPYCERVSVTGWSCRIQKNYSAISQDVITIGFSGSYNAQCYDNGVETNCSSLIRFGETRWNSTIAGNFSPNPANSTSFTPSAIGNGFIEAEVTLTDSVTGGVITAMRCPDLPITVQTSNNDIIRVNHLRMESAAAHATDDGLVDVKGALDLSFLSAANSLIGNYRLQLLDDRGAVTTIPYTIDNENDCLGSKTEAINKTCTFTFQNVPAKEYYSLRIIINAARTPSGTLETILANNTATTSRFYAANVQNLRVPELPETALFAIALLVAGILLSKARKQA